MVETIAGTIYQSIWYPLDSIHNILHTLVNTVCMEHLYLLSIQHIPLVIFLCHVVHQCQLSTLASGVARNCQMGVLEKVGRSMPRAQSAHISAPVRGVWGSSPRIFFVLHALRLILMQSRQRNVDEMKYTIANITMNIIVSLLSQVARMSPSSLRREWRRGPQHSG